MSSYAKPRRRKGSAPLGRADRSPFSMWFWEIDRVLLLLVLLLISIGLIAVAAASPAATSRTTIGGAHLPALYFFWRQLVFVSVGLPIMFIISTMPTLTARRYALIGAGLFALLLVLVPLLGASVNGAQRWIGTGLIQIQPSEFFKPFYVVAIAWLISLREQDPDLPIMPLTGALTALIAALLMKEPDFGQTIIICGSWLALMLLGGMPMKLIGLLSAAGAAGVAAAYAFYPVATQRINSFLFPASGEHSQIDAARETIMAGGFFGTGPGAGQMKYRLPESQTDYIFSVIGEEFGLIMCALVACLFLAIIVRVFVRLLDDEDRFRILAAAGLALQLGMQALINMAVNVGLAPSKGMTLPFISYGGSSMIALCIGFGLLLAFTRRNPYLTRSPYVVKWNRR